MRRPNSSHLSPLCAACILLLASGTVIAQNNTAPAKPAEIQSYRSGLKSIVIPPPTADLSEMGSDYRVLAESFAPDTNRLLAAFLTADDSANLRSGVSKPFSRYALVETLRRAEFTDINADTYKQVADAVAQQFGAALDAPTKDQQDVINRKLKAMRGVDATLTVDKPMPLGALFAKPNARGFGMIEPISGGASSVRMVVGMTILRVQSRLIYAFVYSVYKDDESVQWVRTTSEKWADAILKANQP